MPYMDSLNAMDIVLVVLVAEGQGHSCSCTGRASPFNFIFSHVCKKVDVINDSIYFFYVLFVCPLFVKGSPQLLFPILLAPPRPLIEGGVLLY